jgi:hypothetical protein
MVQLKRRTTADDCRTSTEPTPRTDLQEDSTDRDALDALLAEIVPTRAVGPAADTFRAVARELSRNVTAWSTILDEHLPSPDGRFCAHRQCRMGGYGSLVTRHPCSTRTLALIARACHEVEAGRVRG